MAFPKLLLMQKKIHITKHDYENIISFIVDCSLLVILAELKQIPIIFKTVSTLGVSNQNKYCKDFFAHLRGKDSLLEKNPDY